MARPQSKMSSCVTRSPVAHVESQLRPSRCLMLESLWARSLACPQSETLVLVWLANLSSMSAISARLKVELANAVKAIRFVYWPARLGHLFGRPLALPADWIVGLFVRLFVCLCAASGFVVAGRAGACDQQVSELGAPPRRAREQEVEAERSSSAASSPAATPTPLFANSPVSHKMGHLVALFVFLSADLIPLGDLQPASGSCSATVAKPTLGRPSGGNMLEGQ